MWTFFRSFPVIEQENFGRPFKTAFFASIKSLWRKNCFGKQMKVFIIFKRVSTKFSAPCRVFRRGCWSCILRVQNNILPKNIFFLVFFHFWTLSDIFDQSRKKASGVDKLVSQFQWIFSGDFLLENLQTVIFWISSGKSSTGCRKKNKLGFQAALYLPIGTFWGK